MTSEQLTVMAFLRAKPGKEAELGQALLALAGPSRGEAGCIDYDVHQANDDAAQWVVYENWRSRAALDEHMSTTHMAQFVAASAELLAGNVDMRYLTMRSTPVAR